MTSTPGRPPRVCLAPDHLPTERAKYILHEDGTPYQADELPVMVALRTGEMVSGVVAAVRNDHGCS